MPGENSWANLEESVRKKYSDWAMSDLPLAWGPISTVKGRTLISALVIGPRFFMTIVSGN